MPLRLVETYVLIEDRELDVTVSISHGLSGIVTIDDVYDIRHAGNPFPVWLIAFVITEPAFQERVLEAFDRSAT